MWRIAPALAAIALALSGCGGGGGGCSGGTNGAGEKVTKQYQLSDYASIAVASGISADISSATANTLSIQTFGNLVDHLDIKVVDGALQVRFKDTVCNAEANAVVKVKTPLKGVTASGGSKVTIDELASGIVTATGGSPITVKNFGAPGGTISAQGGSPVTVENFTAAEGTLTISAEGGSPVKVSAGKVGEVSVTAGGGSRIKFGKLAAMMASISANGGSSVTDLETQSLSFTINGGSSIAADVKTMARGTCSGGGSVTIRGGADKSRIAVSGGCANNSAAEAKLVV